MLAGADSGALTADPATPGIIHFSRSLPLAKAKKPESVIAWGMNGADLTPSHGFPLRAVIGGWYGMASVKWLNRIVVTDRPYQGYFQTMDYSYYTRPTGSDPEIIPVTEIQPKAAIARPGPNEIVSADKPYRVFGAAWAGESKVAKVEVSADGGKTWIEAKLDEKPKPFCWVKWRWEWTPAARGPAKLLAKCTDERGTTQPAKRDGDRRAYAINHWVPVDVQVR
jgi:DMSO/TMAO reductase YedYZ molybdopterin-dependent catalytic subunit